MNIFEEIKKQVITRDLKYIVIHHSQTKDGITVDWDQITNYHVKTLGYDANAYNYGLEYVNGRLVWHIGRSLNMVGAHCRGERNRDSIGICLIGNFDEQNPTHDQYFNLASVCRILKNKFDIHLKNIHPHWAYNCYKTCPGERFNFVTLRKYILGKNV